MSRPIKTGIVFDGISTRDAAAISAMNMDIARQHQIRTLHPCIFSKCFSKISDSSITEHQISLDRYDSTPGEWRDI